MSGLSGVNVYTDSLIDFHCCLFITSNFFFSDPLCALCTLTPALGGLWAANSSVFLAEFGVGVENYKGVNG